MKRSIAALAALGATALVLTACAGGDAEATGDTVKIAIQTDPGSLNPITNATDAGQNVLAFGYESLLNYPPGEDPEGILAESWEATTTEVAFTLKDGIVCADGEPLTASDVKATFEYAADDATGSPFKGVYFPASGLTIAADDDARTVTFTAENAESFLAETIGSLPIVCASGLSDPSVLESEFHGTGPYTLEDFSPGQTYDYALRDDYAWGPGGVTSKTEGLPANVEVQIVESDATSANLLQTGEVDIATVGGTERDRLDSQTFTQTLDVPLRPGLVFFNRPRDASATTWSCARRSPRRSTRARSARSPRRVAASSW